MPNKTYSKLPDSPPCVYIFSVVLADVPPSLTTPLQPDLVLGCFWYVRLLPDEGCALTRMMRGLDISNPDLIMPLPQLPIEIVLRILDLSNSPSSDPKLLQCCSLVCKAWSAHAQKMLFRSISISTHRGYTALITAFQPRRPRGGNGTAITRGSHSAKSPPLASIAGIPPALCFPYSDVLRRSVVELNVIIDFNQYDGLTFPKLSHVVSLCPNLRGIGISIFGMQPQGKDAVGTPDQWRMRRSAPPIPGEVLEKLRTAPSASRISELRLNDWSDDPEALLQLLSIWPHITSLKIAGKLPKINSNIDPASFMTPLDAAPCALETLSLNCTTGTETNVDFVKWLLKGSKQTLRRLEFLKEPSGKLLEDILLRSTYPLESVYLPSCTSPAVGQILRHRLRPAVAPVFGGDDEIGEDHTFLRLQGLKEVFVEDPSTPLKFLVSTVRSGTVRRLGFGLDVHTDLSCVARAVKAQAGLERLAVLSRDGGERNSGLGSLRIACAIRGIELEETRDVKEFRSWRG